MTRIRLSAFSPLLLCLPLPAQQDPMAMPGPAPELAKLKPLAGHWRGTGTALMEPGKPPSPWTAQVHSEWVLGGHWLQTDTAIEFEGGMKMRFREYLGWDRENGRYAQVAVNNLGEAVLVTPHLVGDDTLVLLYSMLRQGKPEAERAVTKFGADGQTFAITFLTHEGAAIEGVKGKFERVAKAEPEALEAAHALMPVESSMAKVARMTGRFAIAGEMTMAPGMPSMKIKGVDSVRTLFDGAIVQTETKGSAEGMPGAYEAHGYIAWNAADKCYRIVMVSNMGEVMAGDGRFAGDDKLIQIFTGLRMGQPCVARSVLQLDQDGRPVKVKNHSCMGDAEPMCDFVGTYELQREPQK